MLTVCTSADQAVMMVKEPDNEYDHNAIAVQTLSGQALGYVPREHTPRFPHDTTFGHVYSLGQTPQRLWGATVSIETAHANGVLCPHVQILSIKATAWHMSDCHSCSSAHIVLTYVFRCGLPMCCSNHDV